MKNPILSLVLGAAASLALATPGYCVTILSFTGSATGAANGVTTSGSSSSTITGFTSTAVPYTTLNYSSVCGAGGCTLGSAFLQLSGSTLTLSGTVYNTSTSSYLSGYSTAANILTISLSSALTTTSLTSLNINSASISSILVNTTLLSDLSIPTTDIGSLLGFGINGTGAAPNFTVTSTTLTVNETAAATPEPVSMALCGSGLIGLYFLQRRRRHAALPVAE